MQQRPYHGIDLPAIIQATVPLSPCDFHAVSLGIQLREIAIYAALRGTHSRKEALSEIRA